MFKNFFNKTAVVEKEEKIEKTVEKSFEINDFIFVCNDDVQTKKQQLSDARKKLGDLEKNAFSCEKFLTEELKNTELRLQREIARAEVREKFDGKYKIIDLSFLARHKYQTWNGSEITVPVFAIYRLFGADVRSCNIILKKLRRFEEKIICTLEDISSLKILSSYARCFIRLESYSSVIVVNKNAFFKRDDLVSTYIKNRFNDEAASYIELNLNSDFHGLIPQESKEKILEARDLFGYQSVHFIAECPQWSVKEKVINDDPIVVAYYEEADCFLYVDKFDTTPVEEFMRKEFTID